MTLPAVATDIAAPAVATDAPQIHVHQARPNLLVLSGAGGNVAVWSGPGGVVLVDSGSAAAASALFDTIARVAPGHLRFVVNTHGHPDHVGGNAIAAEKGAVVVGHETLLDLPLADRDDAGPAPAPPALVTTNDSLALHVNDERLDVVHVAGSHTGSDMVVRWDAADVVHLGDVFANGRYPFIDIDAGGSLAGMVAAVEATLARSTDNTVIIPGHGPVSRRVDLAAYRDMLVGVGRRIREAIEQGQGLDEILQSHPTAEFDGRFGQDSPVTPDEFVRIVHRDLADRRSGR
jgi:glyoxylase-like metal-dependent hydrolase (beta-lactamase superfamily II)